MQIYASIYMLKIQFYVFMKHIVAKEIFQNSKQKTVRVGFFDDH